MDDDHRLGVAALSGLSGRQARAALARELAWWGAPVLDDPGTGELACMARSCASERSRAADPRMQDASALLHRAADALDAADRLRGSLRPAISHHLRHAYHLAARARARLTDQSPPLPAGAVGASTGRTTGDGRAAAGNSPPRMR
ncbi:hypothetical protein ACFV1W_34645 [Kitasatospora sp. NPDC059648]|uniref:hypothetical protein n=1 Tax=Kitasatospora sp. NPDC059648 TaxID=3346894 RepID=UPI00369508D2